MAHTSISEQTVDATVVDLFDHWAAKAPDRIAAEFHGETLTYSQLRNASLHVSHALLKASVEPRSKIPVLTQMSLEMLPTIIGVLRVGACYAPIDVAAWSISRVEAVLLELSSPIAIVSTGCTGFELPVMTINFQTKWLRNPVLDEKKDGLYRKLDAIRADFRAYDLAWIVFTSGTTGRPKGVMVYHRGIHAVSVLEHGADLEAAAKRGIRCLLAFSIAFDGCAGVVWTTLTKGATLYMATPSTFPEVASRCDLLHLTPSMLAILDSAGAYDNVRYIFLGAEAPKLEIVRQWITPTRRVFSTYGPSETTCIISLGEMKPDEEPDFGDLLPGVSVALVDEDLHECLAGEVVISGPGVAAGYLNNPKLTAEKFIQWKGQRWYKTGDLARRTADGKLIWAGRADSLIKNRGFLVNLETEVEPAMRSFSTVRLAVATKWRDRLVGFVQPGTVDATELRSFMAERCDPFIVPDEIFAMDSFPLSVNGKTDRIALAAQLEERVASNEVLVMNEYSTSAYDALRIAFALCLQVPFQDLSRESSFIELGGNSLAAIRVVRTLKENGYAASIFQVLQLNTIGLLEPSIVRQRDAEEVEYGANGIEHVPMPDMQRAMVERSMKNTSLYALIGTLTYIGDPNHLPSPKEIHDACTRVVSAHSVFQSRFDLSDWTIADYSTRTLGWNAVSVGEEEFERTCEELEARARSFLTKVTHDMLEVPYLYITCVSVPNSKSLALVICVHHSLTDAYSSAILIRDFERALAGQDVPKGPPFQDYARFMQRYTRENLDGAVKMFEKLLEPLSCTSPLLFPSPSTQLADEVFTLKRFDSPTTTSKSALDASARSKGVTASTLTYAAWALFLTKISGYPRVGFSLSLSGRTIPWPPAQAVVGPLTTRAPYSIAIPHGNTTVIDFLVEVYKTTVNVLQFDGIMHALPDAMMLDQRTKSTCVVCLLDMEQSSANWSYKDTQNHHFEMLWHVFDDGGALRTELDVQLRHIDPAWAEEICKIPGKLLDKLVNATEMTTIAELLN